LSRGTLDIDCSQPAAFLKPLSEYEHKAGLFGGRSEVSSKFLLLAYIEAGESVISGILRDRAQA
jgi:hypothetical protein